jgi:hypothetical protein
MGILSPVLVATGIEEVRLVLVDGFKRVQIATDRGDTAIWVRRLAIGATAAKVAMIAANAGHRGLSDVEEAWIVQSLCVTTGLFGVWVPNPPQSPGTRNQGTFAQQSTPCSPWRLSPAARSVSQGREAPSGARAPLVRPAWARRWR